MRHIHGAAALLSYPQALEPPRRVPSNVSPDVLTMGVPVGGVSERTGTSISADTGTCLAFLGM